MNQKVLVTYASKAGSTMEIAQAVAKELAARGFSVDVRPIKQAASPDGYSAVVIGSAIRMGAPLPEVTKFIEQNSAALRGLPTAFFAVHLMHIADDEPSQAGRRAYLDPVRKLVPLAAEGYFAGVGDIKKVSMIEGMIYKMVKAPVGDHRDWNAINTWARALFA